MEKTKKIEAWEIKKTDAKVDPPPTKEIGKEVLLQKFITILYFIQQIQCKQLDLSRGIHVFYTKMVYKKAILSYSKCLESSVLDF